VYGQPYMSVVEAAPVGGTTTIVVRGFSPVELRRYAEKNCSAVFGETPWRITGESFVPCLVSLGGRVRLYEGRFSATRA
jgi:hypothetical protein